MKKIMIFLFLVTSLLIPLNVFAVTYEGKISTTSVQTKNYSTKIGEYFTVTFGISFSGLQKNTNDTYGIGAVGFTIQMDNNDFLISSVSSDIWDTGAYDLGNGNYYILSEYIEGSDNSNACAQSELYCSDYKVDVEFFVKNTNKSSSPIVMSSATVGFIDLSKEYVEITENDVITATHNDTATVVMNIQQTSNNTVYQEPSNATEKTNNVPSVKSNTPTNKIDVGSNNNDTPNQNNNNNMSLKSLKVDGYSLKFSKNKRNYIIDADDEVNSLKVIAVAEGENASVNIVGADDLKKNKDKVTINIKDQSGNTGTYTINVQRKSVEVIVDKSQSKSGFKLKKETIIIGGIIIGVILLIVIIVLLLNRVRDKKIDNILDNI